MAIACDIPEDNFRKENGIVLPDAFFDYEVKPTVNCVVPDVVFGISYTFIV